MCSKRSMKKRVFERFQIYHNDEWAPDEICETLQKEDKAKVFDFRDYYNENIVGILDELEDENKIVITAKGYKINEKYKENKKQKKYKANIL